MYIMPSDTGFGKFWPENRNGREDYVEKYWIPYLRRGRLTIWAILLSPKSRGSVKLRSRNLNDDPIVNPNYLSHPMDVLQLIEGVKTIRRFPSTQSYRNINGTVYGGLVPGCEQYKAWSDQYIECYVRTFCWTGFNYAGTCRMGDASDPRSVVDPKLRVLGGISGLRVGDASVMPTITRGAINAPTVMIGERAAEFILQEWNIA
jgi:choline dehydrogenase-like flavoprotein